MKKNKTIINYLYSSGYQLLLIILPLITTPYISRVLGAEKIGLYSYSYAIAYYFVILIMLGLNNYGSRTIASVRDDKNKLAKAFSEIYLMQIIMSIALVILYILYGLIFSNNPITWIMLIYVVSGALDINWLYTGLEKFKVVTIRSSLIKITSVLLIFLLVKNENDILKYSLINVTGMLISQLILWAYIRKITFIKKTKIKNIVKHIKPNLMLFVPVIAICIYKMMDKIMLGSMTNFEQVGYYESTEKIVQVPLALITALGTIMMPKMSNLVANKQYSASKKYIEKSLYFATAISSLMSFGIMALSDKFVPWYYGENYKACIVLFKIIMPSCIFLAIANVIRTQYLIPYKLDKIYIKSVITGSIINLVINILLIPKLGAEGASYGTLIAEATVCAMQVFMIRKEYPIMTQLVNCIKYIIIGIIVYIVLVITPNISNIELVDLAIKAILGGLIYLIASYGFLKKDIINDKRLYEKK